MTALSLDDTVGTARKVMLASPISVGAIVEIKGEGFFRVKRLLAPAAPRTWRAYLEPDATIASIEYGDRLIPVEALADDATSIKVMALVDLASPPAVGSSVQYGQRTCIIERVLAPAAPRGWRFYLTPVAVEAQPEPTPAPIAPEPIASTPDAPAPVAPTPPVAKPEPAKPELVMATADAVSNAGSNLPKVFVIKVSTLGGTNIRKSTVEYRIPYARFSEELKRIQRSGGTVVSITEGSLLA